MLEARSLAFGYSSSSALLTDWNATFRPGEVTAITGPSGRGKSTLLYLLGLMLKPASGGVYLDGEKVSSLPDGSRAMLRASQYGFVFQDAALDQTRTILDNVVEASLYRNADRRAAKARALILLESFGVELKATSKPGQVSGGQAQRIALCRALLANPRVVLADEPTGNLDPVATETVVNALHAHAAQGGIVIVVTHDPTLVSRCDRELRL